MAASSLAGGAASFLEGFAMIEGDGILLPAEALAEAKAFLRIGHGGEDALVAGVLRTAAELCEQFTWQVLIVRAFQETLAPQTRWQRLGRAPVRAIGAVEALPAGGAAVPLAAAAYAVDIDAAGEGWVRVTGAGDAPLVRVSFEAGLAATYAGLPETLRHGMVRLAAHLYAQRSGEAPDTPPAAVSALWRPWRRMTLAAARRL